MDDGVDSILAWHAEGLSWAEIGRRLGLSSDRVRAVLAEHLPAADLPPAEPDDNQPNHDGD